MDYLVIKLWPWMLAAFALGIAIGWLSCGRDRNNRRLSEQNALE
jgi:hypothetical protein